MTIKLDLRILDAGAEPAWPELAEHTFETDPNELRVAILQDGMTSGKTSVAILARIQVAGADVDDPPAWICIETSAAVIHGLAGAIRGAEARWNAALLAGNGSVETAIPDEPRRVAHDEDPTDV